MTQRYFPSRRARIVDLIMAFFLLAVGVSFLALSFSSVGQFLEDRKARQSLERHDNLLDSVYIELRRLNDSREELRWYPPAEIY